MTLKISETDAKQASDENVLRYILIISSSLAVCALLGVAYIYI